MKNPPEIGTIWDTKNNGVLQVIGYTSKYDVQVRFLSTGYETTTYSSSVRSGYVKDPYHPRVGGVGFIGEGDYGINKNGKNNRAYIVWKGMIQRCYSSLSHKGHPTYIDCRVSEDWHNYQNFARWYEDNYPEKEGKYQLDKDLLILGNKVYSSNTCIFVPDFINSFISLKESKGACRKGVRHRSHGFEAGVGGDKYLGTFSSESEAHIAWVRYKVSLAQDMKTLLDELDTRLYPNIIRMIQSELSEEEMENVST